MARFRPLSWLPPSAASFVYTVLLKPPLLRKLARRIICLLIPDEIPIHGATLVLNRTDAIVSGNLALGCYETYNLELFRSRLRPGMRVADVGANIGVYSAVAALVVGAEGRVLSVEPDAENCAFLRATRDRNQFSWMTVVQKAVGDRCGVGQLYLCDENKADHRIYDTASPRHSVRVDMVTLDALLDEQALERLDFLKIDTQGAEHRVLAGMTRLLRENRTLAMLMEFWPWGIRQAGGSPRELLDHLAGLGFSIQVVDGDRGSLSPVRDPASIVGLDLERQHLDLLLERRS